MDKTLYVRQVTIKNRPEFSAQDTAATINGETEITEDIHKVIKKVKKHNMYM